MKYSRLIILSNDNEKGKNVSDAELVRIKNMNINIDDEKYFVSRIKETIRTTKNRNLKTSENK